MTSQRPRVAVDAHHIGRRATGNETYVRGLLEGLAAQPDVAVAGLADEGVTLPSGVETRYLRHHSSALRLLRDLTRPGRSWRADLLHVQYVRPPRCDVPVVTTIHDISFERFPVLFPRRSRLRMRATIPWSARHSAMVLTGSEHSRADLLAAYRLAPERVVVTPYAADSRFRVVAADEARRLLAGLALPDGYLLCVGNLQPRKNLGRLIDAYALLPADVRPPLVIVGQPAWQSRDLDERVRRHGIDSDVRFTGFVTSDQLVGLYNLARAFAFPSLYEGFGLPVLEALACGVPTLTSDRSSLPEVAGTAAVLTDPERTEEIADGLRAVICDEVLRARLQAAGPVQAARFSWARCAGETVTVYREALGR